MIETESLLHIAVETTDAGAVARIVTSPVGEATAPFIPPLDAQQLDAFWENAVSSDEQPADFDVHQTEMRAAGEKLFNALFTGPLLSAYHNSLAAVYQQRGLLHMRLSLPDDSNILTLPWEYLFDPTREEFLSLSLHSPLMRYIERRHQIRPLNITRPLRVLVVVTDAGGANSVDVDREWIKLIDTLDYLGMDGRLLLDRLDRPTLFELQRQLRRQPYHILHVIGHTVYNEAAGDGRLIIEDEVGHKRMISGQHLGQLLRDHYTTRLVILQSTDEEMDARNPLGLVAQNLVPRGIPAAVVLPTRLPDKLMLAFLHDLYAAVVDCKPIDLAMAAARNAMAGEMPNVLWGTPWLLARTVDGYIFDDGSRPAPKPATQGHAEPSLLERVLRSTRVSDL